MVGQLAHRRVPGEVRRRNLDGEDDEVSSTYKVST